jgi:HlyD family secretion protein
MGRVLRLGREVDTATREFTVDIVPSELPPHWAVGQRSTVAITTGLRQDAIAVPATALAPRSGRPGVWIADGQRATWREIEVGPASGALVEVDRGIGAGDIVLLDPAARYAWEPIEVTESPAVRP